jgi:hypothetical protein
VCTEEPLRRCSSVPRTRRASDPATFRSPTPATLQPDDHRNSGLVQGGVDIPGSQRPMQQCVAGAVDQPEWVAARVDCCMLVFMATCAASGIQSAYGTCRRNAIATATAIAKARITAQSTTGPVSLVPLVSAGISATGGGCSGRRRASRTREPQRRPHHQRERLGPRVEPDPIGGEARGERNGDEEPSVGRALCVTNLRDNATSWGCTWPSSGTGVRTGLYDDQHGV